MIDPDVIEAFLAKPPPWLPAFKGSDPQTLRDMIHDLTGLPLSTRTPPRPHQLEALAFAFYQNTALLLLEMRLGKALDFNCPVATPDGWRKIGELRVGDDVLSPNGSRTTVTGVFAQGVRPMFWVEFTDGAGVACDADHLWTVNTAGRRHRGLPYQTKTLTEIMAEPLRETRSKGYRNFIPMTEPVIYTEVDFVIDPYLLGVLLGDGSLSSGSPSITTDQVIVDHLVLPPTVTAKYVDHASAGITTAYLTSKIGSSNPLLIELRKLGLYGCVSAEKFIPPSYLTAGIEQRKALLAGLLDTDGGMEGKNNVHWGSVSFGLASNVQELVRSLGGTAKINTKNSPKFTYKGEIRTDQPYYHMSIRLPASLGCPFRLRRKAAAWKPFTKFQPQRAIKSITPLPAAEAVCISVHNDDGLFVIKDYVVTHNTWTALNFAQHLRDCGKMRKKGLVIVHAPIALDVWESEAAKHCYLKVATVRNQMSELLNALESDADLIIIPWSGLQNILTVSRKTKQGKVKLYPDLEACRIIADDFDLAIIDEIHTAKNHQSLRFKIASELVQHCRYRVGLTGTPFGRSPFALWAQAFLIDGGRTLGRNYYFFEAAFGKLKKNWFTNRDEYQFDKKKMGILEEKLAGLAISYRLRDCQNVPVLKGTVAIGIHGDQRKAYDDCVDKIIELPDHERVEIQNSFIRLRQISSGYLPFVDQNGVERTIHFDANAKMEWLTDVFLAQDEIPQTIIFVEYTETGRLVCEALTKAKITHVWLHGATKDRKGTVAAFQDGKVKIIVAQSAAGGMAIELSSADYLLFYESPVSPIIRAQAEARPLSSARGDRPVIIEDLTCSGVETKIQQFITEGKSLMDAIVHERRNLKAAKKRGGGRIRRAEGYKCLI